MTRRYSDGDKIALNAALDKVLTGAGGLAPGNFTEVFTSLLDREVLTTNTTLYVETTGDDNNLGTSIDKPLRTVQAAIDYFKRYIIQAPAAIQLGQGAFSGFTVENINTAQAQGTLVTGNTLTIQGTLTIKGTLGLATDVTSNSGTATSGAAGVLNDTNQNWTVNELKGKLLEYNTTTGPVSTKVWIYSNTATSITFLSSGTPIVGAYRILDHKTSISPTFGIASAAVTYGAVVSANNRVAGSSDIGSGIIFDSIDFTTDSSSFGYALLAMGSCQVASCRFLQTTGNMSAGIAVSGKCNVNASNTLFKTTKASSTGITILSGSYSATRTWHWGTAQVGQIGISINTSGAASLECRSAALYESLGIAVKTTSSPVQGNLYGTFINNLTCIDVTGSLAIQDSKVNLPTWPLTSAGNTNFVTARGGAIIAIGSTIPSGLATNDITMATANPVAIYTLAAMRALTPAAVTDTLGTVVGTQGTVL